LKAILLWEKYYRRQKSNRLRLAEGKKRTALSLIEKGKKQRNIRGDRTIVTGKLFRMDKSLGKV